MKKKLIYVFTGLVLFGASSCNKLEDFGDTNLNPSATTEPILAALLTNAEAGIGGYASQTRSGLYAQYFSETQYTDVSLYSIPQLDFAGEYAGVLNDLQMIINKNQNKNMNAVAKILKQYIFSTVTDRWGDVPYSEALSGKSTPKYDKQEDIYKGMIKALKEVVGEFDNTSLISGDVIFNGDVASWKRTANSIRLMLALQLSKRYPGASEYAATEFKAALADPAGLIVTNSQNFIVDYPGGNYKSNWWRVYDGRKDYGESKTVTDLMASLSDSRQNAFGGITQDGTSPDAFVTSNIGVPYGLKRADAEAFTAANTGWARILRGDVRKETGDVVVISAAQIALAKAEAANYGWTTDVLATVYNQGIALSFEQWGQTMSVGYTTQTNVTLGAVGAAGNLGKIATQRYIASYPNGLQAWNIWRKTGFPVLMPTPNATNSTKTIPRRYVYAASEYTSNKASIEAALTNLPGGDKMDSKIWWDAN